MSSRIPEAQACGRKKRGLQQCSCKASSPHDEQLTTGGEVWPSDAPHGAAIEASQGRQGISRESNAEQCVPQATFRVNAAQGAPSTRLKSWQVGHQPTLAVNGPAHWRCARPLFWSTTHARSASCRCSPHHYILSAPLCCRGGQSPRPGGGAGQAAGRRPPSSAASGAGRHVQSHVRWGGTSHRRGLKGMGRVGPWRCRTLGVLGHLGLGGEGRLLQAAAHEDKGFQRQQRPQHRADPARRRA